MSKRNYSITLEEEVVKKAKEKLKIGQKLSPIIEELLRRWILENGRSFRD